MPAQPLIGSIPTYYHGVQYRSRLEARWAAFFRACGWLADYEPLDLPGYIPDFLLRWPAGQHLVEVKPATTPEGLIAVRVKLRSGAQAWLNDPQDRAAFYLVQLRALDHADCFGNLAEYDECLTCIATAEAEQRGVIALGAILFGDPSLGQVVTLDGMHGLVACPGIEGREHVGVAFAPLPDRCLVCGHQPAEGEELPWVDSASVFLTWRAAGNATQYKAP
jgi:hypothetical protein